MFSRSLLMASESVHERNKLPDGAIIQVELEIIGYFDEGGELKLATRCDADSPISTIVGLMEQAKFVLLSAWDRNSEFDDIPEDDDD